MMGEFVSEMGAWKGKESDREEMKISEYLR